MRVSLPAQEEFAGGVADCPPEANVSRMLPPVVILFGSPGSGKGTQARLLGHCVRGPHISTGDMLRSHIQAGDSIGRTSEGLIKSGRLVPDELVNELIEQRLSQTDCGSGLILDGYPRTLNQAEVLLGILHERGFRPAVIHLSVDYEKIVARLSGRRQCPVCGTLYSITSKPPKVPGVCDLEGAFLVTREDDREAVIRERLDQYESQTRPLLEYFKDAGVPTFQVDGSSARPEQIAEQICENLARNGLTVSPTAGRSMSVSDASVTS